MSVVFIARINKVLPFVQDFEGYQGSSIADCRETLGGRLRVLPILGSISSCFIHGKARFEHWQLHYGVVLLTIDAKVERLI
jgi:hypothetical protein